MCKNILIIIEYERVIALDLGNSRGNYCILAFVKSSNWGGKYIKGGIKLSAELIYENVIGIVTCIINKTLKIEEEKQQ